MVDVPDTKNARLSDAEIDGLAAMIDSERPDGHVCMSLDWAEALLREVREARAVVAGSAVVPTRQDNR